MAGHDKPSNGPTKEEPSFILSPFASVSTVSRSHPFLVSLSEIIFLYYSFLFHKTITIIYPWRRILFPNVYSCSTTVNFLIKNAILSPSIYSCFKAGKFLLKCYPLCSTPTVSPVL
jgi:hypothetical protein